MPGALDKFLGLYGGDVQELLGNVSDLHVTDNYREAMDKLNSMDAEKERVAKFYDMYNRLQGVDDNMVPKEREIEEQSFNYDDPRMYQSDNELNKRYADYVENYKKVNPDKEVMAFDKYVEAIPGLKDQLSVEGYYKTGKTKQSLTPEERQAEKYRLAGFEEQDIADYEQMLNEKLNQDDYNRKLQNLVYKYYPMLTSQGSKKDQMAKLFEKQAGEKVLSIKQGQNGEWKFEIEGGNVIKYNPKTGQYSVSTLGKQEKETTKGWDIFEDANGNPYWGERVNKDGKWGIEFRSELDPAEKRDYEQNLQIKSNKLEKSGRQPRGSRGPRGRVDKITSNEADEIMKYDDADNLTKAEMRQKAELMGNKQVLAEYDKIDRKEIDADKGDYEDESDQGTLDFFDKYADEIDAAWESGDQDKFHQLQDGFLAELEKYKGKLSKEDYWVYKKSYQKY